MDILAIRDALNQLPFRDGQRQVFIGRISDHVAIPQPDDEDEDEEDRPHVIEDTEPVLRFVRQMEDALAKYDLTLVRDSETRDELYAVQRLKTQTNVDLSWMGDAYIWSARIMTVAAVMVLPGLGGLWLDERYNTKWIGLAGFALGMLIGIAYLFSLTKKSKQTNAR